MNTQAPTTSCLAASAGPSCPGPLHRPPGAPRRATRPRPVREPDHAFTAAVTLAEDLTLVDETGRIVRGDKRGTIPANLAPILDRLRIDLDAWFSLMRSGGHFGLGSFGALASRAREALRRGAKWIVNTTAGLYRDDRARSSGTTN